MRRSALLRSLASSTAQRSSRLPWGPWAAGRPRPQLSRAHAMSAPRFPSSIYLRQILGLRTSSAADDPGPTRPSPTSRRVLHDTEVRIQIPSYSDRIASPSSTNPPPYEGYSIPRLLIRFLAKVHLSLCPQIEHVANSPEFRRLKVIYRRSILSPPVKVHSTLLNSALYLVALDLLASPLKLELAPRDPRYTGQTRQPCRIQSFPELNCRPRRLHLYVRRRRRSLPNRHRRPRIPATPPVPRRVTGRTPEPPRRPIPESFAGVTIIVWSARWRARSSSLRGMISGSSFPTLNLTVSYLTIATNQYQQMRTHHVVLDSDRNLFLSNLIL